MAVESFLYKPQSTWGVAVETIVEFCCTEKPVVSYNLCGFKQFGFILAYEDKIDARLHNWKRINCNLTDCNRSLRYELEIKYFISSEIGLGIGIGNFGTGAFGVRTRSVEEKAVFQTDCICCDSEIESQTMIQSMLQNSPAHQESRSSIPLVVALLGIGATALALEHLDPSGSTAEYLLAAVSVGVMVAGIAVYLRIRMLRKAIRKEID